MLTPAFSKTGDVSPFDSVTLAELIPASVKLRTLNSIECKVTSAGRCTTSDSSGHSKFTSPGGYCSRAVKTFELTLGTGALLAVQSPDEPESPLDVAP